MKRPSITMKSSRELSQFSLDPVPSRTLNHSDPNRIWKAIQTLQKNQDRILEALQKLGIKQCPNCGDAMKTEGAEYLFGICEDCWLHDPDMNLVLEDLPDVEIGRACKVLFHKYHPLHLGIADELKGNHLSIPFEIYKSYWAYIGENRMRLIVAKFSRSEGRKFLEDKVIDPTKWTFHPESILSRFGKYQKR